MKLDELSELNSYDLAQFCNVTHKEILRRTQLLISKRLIPEKEQVKIKPLDGTRARLGFKYELHEYLYLVCKYYNRTLDKFKEFMDLILRDGEITSRELNMKEFKIGLDFSSDGLSSELDSTAKVPKLETGFLDSLNLDSDLEE